MRARAPGVAGVAALAALASAAPADEPHEGAPWAPCLAARPTLDAYVSALQDEGWKLVPGSAREQALQGPAEAIYYYAGLTMNAPPFGTLDEQLADAHGDIPVLFDGSTVLRRDGAAMMVDVTPPLEGWQGLNCILTAPALPEVDAALAAATPQRRGPLALVSIPAATPAGTANLEIEALRHDPGTGTPLAGGESVILQLSVKVGP